MDSYSSKKIVEDSRDSMAPSPIAMCPISSIGSRRADFQEIAENNVDKIRKQSGITASHRFDDPPLLSHVRDTGQRHETHPDQDERDEPDRQQRRWEDQCQ